MKQKLTFAVLHIVWLLFALPLSALYGTPRFFHGLIITLAGLFDVGGIYLLTVLIPAVVYYLIKIGSDGRADLELARSIIQQMLFASAASLVLVMMTFRYLPVLHPSRMLFILPPGLSFSLSSGLPLVRRHNEELRTALAVGLVLLVIAGMYLR